MIASAHRAAPDAGLAATGDDRPRWPSAIAVAVLGLVLTGRLASVPGTGQPGQVPFVVALFVVPLTYAIPAARGLLTRYRWWLLAVQTVLTCVPYAIFGARWAVGVTGLLAGLVLLTMPGRRAWPLAGLVLVADLAVRAWLTGLPYAPAPSAMLWTTVAFVDECLAFYGTVRLAGLVLELRSARGEVTELAVARERLRAAEELQSAVGEHLADVAAAAVAAQRALAKGQGSARQQIEAAGVTARAAVARVRAVATVQAVGTVEAVGTVPGALSGGEPAPPRGGQPAAPPEPGTAIAPQLAWTILVVVTCGYAAQLLNTAYLGRLSRTAATVTVCGTIAGAALQLYHSRRVLDGGRPRAWPVTLGLQTALAYVPFLLVPVHYVGDMAGLAAGTILLLVPGRWRWAGFLVVVGSWTLLFAVVPQQGALANPGSADDLYVLAASAVSGLLVYGLSRLAITARQMQVLRGELTRMAVLAERLRLARDVHDLLGLGLSAVALKTDLIGRLIGRDDARAAAEIGEMSRICANARADLRLVTDAARHLPLDAELAAAQDILSSAGVRVRADAGAGPRPPAADTVLAPVLREAVTNILRHSAATAATIEVAAADGALRLHVSNDGVPGETATNRIVTAPQAGPPTAGPPTVGAPTAHEPASNGGSGRSGSGSSGGSGSGLANLAARVRAAGGRLTVAQADGRFELDVQIPLPEHAAARVVAEHVAAEHVAAEPVVAEHGPPQDGAW